MSLYLLHTFNLFNRGIFIMIFKSICLAAALLAAPTNAVPSTDSTKLNNDTAEPKRRLGAVERRDLGSDTKSAFVLLKSDGALGFGHVAGCFELEEGAGFQCFSRDDNDFWEDTKANQEEILNHFKGWGYTDWKRLDVFNADSKQALAKMNELKDKDYNLIFNNCQNNVYDILHDEGSGFGITADVRNRNNGCAIGWVQLASEGDVGPNQWFRDWVYASESGIFWRGKNQQCSSAHKNYCESGLFCCEAIPAMGGTCQKRVNKRWCMPWWLGGHCFDNWTCP
mmetsp:Transcript_8495/g.14431  ORF Transcript_8495/g.14431 Transcript_8495/m.14431 type:complete len:282 (+) Transcript_8495:129-974(+)